jgi:hypothetical protein
MAMKKIKPLKVRRTSAQIFLDKLASLAPDADKFIGNKSLCDSLGWDEDRYKRVRDRLFSQNKIVIGRGQGGSVKLGRVHTILL